MADYDPGIQVQQAWLAAQQQYRAQRAQQAAYKQQRDDQIADEYRKRNFQIQDQAQASTQAARMLDAQQAYGLIAGREQFGQQYQLAQQRYAQQQALADQEMAQRQYEFGTDTGLRRQQMGQQYDLQNRELAERQGEFGATLENQKYQFGADLDLRQKEAQARQQQQEQQFGLQKQEMLNQVDQFGQSLGLKTREEEETEQRADQQFAQYEAKRDMEIDGKISNGDLVVTPQQQQQLNFLTEELGKVNPDLTFQQQREHHRNLRMQKDAILNHLQPPNPGQRQKKLEEIKKASLGAAYETYQHLPWQPDPHRPGQVMLPQGFKMSDTPEYMALKDSHEISKIKAAEQAKIEVQHQTAQAKEDAKNLGDMWMDFSEEKVQIENPKWTEWNALPPRYIQQGIGIAISPLFGGIVSDHIQDSLTGNDSEAYKEPPRYISVPRSQLPQEEFQKHFRDKFMPMLNQYRQAHQQMGQSGQPAPQQGPQNTPPGPTQQAPQQPPQGPPQPSPRTGDMPQDFQSWQKDWAQKEDWINRHGRGVTLTPIPNYRPGEGDKPEKVPGATPDETSQKPEKLNMPVVEKPRKTVRVDSKQYVKEHAADFDEDTVFVLPDGTTFRKRRS